MTTSNEGIRRTINTLFLPRELMEVRTLPTPEDGTIYNGFFWDADTLIAAINQFFEQHRRALYLCPNPVQPRLHNKQPDRIAKAVTTVKDSEVQLRRWLLIDFDPERAVAGAPATDEEKKAAQRN